MMMEKWKIKSEIKMKHTNTNVFGWNRKKQGKIIIIII